MRSVPIERLTNDAFTPFGEVLDRADAEVRLINGGTTQRFHRLARCVTDDAGTAIVSLFRGQPRVLPFEISMMERHPDGSQAFWPLSDRPWLVAVAEDVGGRPQAPRVFSAGPDQGVNYGRNVWHHPLLALYAVSDFVVVDRDGPGPNLEEFVYADPFIIEADSLKEPSS